MSELDLDALLTRAAEHPSELALDEWIAGVLSAARSAEVAAHCAGCEACGAYVAQAREGLAAVPGLDADRLFDRIWAGAEDARAAAAPVEARPRLLSRLKGLFDLRGVGLMVAGAAAALAVVAVVRQPEPPPPLGLGGEGVRAKGSLGLEVARKTPTGSQPMLSGDAFAPGDELRFVVSLPSAGRVEIVGVEADGSLFRAWPLPEMGADPERPAGKAQTLPGAVQLDEAVGTETLHLVVCPPSVEAACASAGAHEAPRCAAGCRSTPFVIVKQAQ